MIPNIPLAALRILGGAGDDVFVLDATSSAAIRAVSFDGEDEAGMDTI